MFVNIKLLGYLKKYNSSGNIQIAESQTKYTVTDLARVLSIPDTENFTVIINDKRVGMEAQLKQDDYVVFLPRISGG